MAAPDIVDKAGGPQPQTLRVRCRACGRPGILPGGTALTRQLRCTTCGGRARVRELLIVERSPVQRRPSASAMKEAAAREILARYRVGALDDDLSDLFRAVRHERR
jgi:hypothetical protein